MSTITKVLAFAAAAEAFEMPLSKVMQRAAPLAVAGALAVSPMAAFADGQGVFEGNCAACHAGGQNVIMPEKTLEKEALEEYLDGGFNEAAVVKQVTNGKGAMPAFGGRLSDDDIKAVASYVISTSKAGWE